MEFVQALFSLKFEPQVRIRRSLNEIEDCLQEYYGMPQTMPIPDDFAAEAPRIVLNSKYGHSQISFSQISADISVGFDGEYKEDFERTKTYILERLSLIKDLLIKIDINSFFFCGITYNVHLKDKNKNTMDFISDILSIKDISNIYEASRRIATVVDDRFFVNQQVGTYKEYQSKGTSIPNLMELTSSKLVDEGVNLSIDVNNRYEYLKSAKSVSLDEFDEVINKIYSFIELELKKWS